MPESDFREAADLDGDESFLEALVTFAEAAPALGVILAGRVTAIETWEAWEKLDFSPTFGPESPYQQVAERGARVGLLDIRRTLEDDVRLRAAEWALREGAGIMLRETEKTRQAVRQLVADALTGEAPLREAARRILGIEGFGLDPWRQKQLENKIAEWIEEGLSRRIVTRRSRKLFKKLRFRRALEVWRHESRSAVMEGFRIALGVAQKAGAVGQAAQIIWRHSRTTEHDACPRCTALIGVEVGVTEDFTSRPVQGGGRRYNGKTLVRRRPPEHNRCDCWLELQA